MKPWFNESMDAFAKAFHCAIAGDKNAALQWLSQTRSPELVEWFDVHAQNTGTFRVRHFGREPRPDDVVLDPVRSVTRFEPAVMSRDGYRCRYCGMRVLPKATLRRFRDAVRAKVFATLGTNRERHGIRMAFSATVDHVVPHSRGGRTVLDNLVTACWACNYGKSNYTLAELGMDDPRDRAPELTGWQGLLDRL